MLARSEPIIHITTVGVWCVALLGSLYRILHCKGKKKEFARSSRDLLWPVGGIAYSFPHSTQRAKAMKCFWDDRQKNIYRAGRVVIFVAAPYSASASSASFIPTVLLLHENEKPARPIEQVNYPSSGKQQSFSFSLNDHLTVHEGTTFQKVLTALQVPYQVAVHPIYFLSPLIDININDTALVPS